MAKLCRQDQLDVLVSEIESSKSDPLPLIEARLAEFPEDGRIHFLHGSVLASAGRLIEAHDALTRAVTLAPDFPLARFQLGLFQLTSGEANEALDTWGRLDRLPDGHHLRMFVEGLRCLIRDDFRGAVQHLRNGIILNQENTPLNRDMQMLIDRCEALASDGAADHASETSLLLNRFSKRLN